MVMTSNSCNRVVGKASAFLDRMIRHKAAQKWHGRQFCCHDHTPAALVGLRVIAPELLEKLGFAGATDAIISMHGMRIRGRVAINPRKVVGTGHRRAPGYK